MSIVRNLSVAAALALSLNASITLDGENLTPKDIAYISNGAKVDISKKAMQKAKKAHEVLLNAAKDGQKIYGLTVGVGLNKDRSFVDAKGNLDAEVIEASTKFNIGLIHAHCGGVGEDMPPNIRGCRSTGGGDKLIQRILKPRHHPRNA